MRAIKRQTSTATPRCCGAQSGAGVEHGAEAVKLGGGFCAGRFGLRGRPHPNVVLGQIYRWRRDLRTAAARFAEVAVAPGPHEGTAAGPGCIGNRTWPRHSHAHCRNGSQGAISDYAGRGKRPSECPERGAGAALVLLACNTEAMQLHLDEIATKISTGAHAILLLDQAGWLVAKALKVPNNISFARAPRFE
jgi:hypothetical protein